jgi:hypothetical protein
VATTENGVNYKVVDQRFTTDVTAAGRFQRVVEIVIQTDRGTSASFELPFEAYNAENVKIAADAMADELERVDSL